MKAHRFFLSPSTFCNVPEVKRFDATPKVAPARKHSSPRPMVSR